VISDTARPQIAFFIEHASLVLAAGRLYRA
jgi:hypothetical protein